MKTTKIRDLINNDLGDKEKLALAQAIEIAEEELQEMIENAVRAFCVTTCSPSAVCCYLVAPKKCNMRARFIKELLEDKDEQ